MSVPTLTESIYENAVVEILTAKSLHDATLFPYDKFPEVKLLNQKVCNILSLWNYIATLVSYLSIPCMTWEISCLSVFVAWRNNKMLPFLSKAHYL